MARLEDLKTGIVVEGLVATEQATVLNATWYGTDALQVAYKTESGTLGETLLFRDSEPSLRVVEAARAFSFDGDGSLFRLVAEARRIQLAHLYDPLLAVHTSVIEPLPHQITAVYETMLPRQPLRFLLADDPGAGKTIMAGLLIKELMARADLRRCLIVCPGSLVEQWQDELYRRFQLPFEILTSDQVEASRTGNWFLEHDLAIARLDKLSRDEALHQKLRAPEAFWDLVVCDEAHKMSATTFGSEVRYTKRYQLGRLLSSVTRHLLLMTATPHNGKEADFRLFLALLDADRFEGAHRREGRRDDATDLMRRMVKESLLRFDGTPLFPERRAYTLPYELSEAEKDLYDAVTQYVQQEFNRADALQNSKQARSVGFALTILQRRLASSPEAILQSLRRRRERLEGILKALEEAAERPLSPQLTEEELEDLEDAPEAEAEEAVQRVVDEATAARTADELRQEIEHLRRLEQAALRVRNSGEDRKWRELSGLLQAIFTRQAVRGVAERREAYDAAHHVASPKEKLVVFTEHRDTLAYLARKIRSFIGDHSAVVEIHGGMGREERAKAQERFLHDPDVRVLVATDAAGEGINLQRAHLMVNYDLPWNPNRLEQRFGRIHRIGQTEVCHLWNLLAHGTREGDVYQRLLHKLEEAKKALGGQVFDVLGKLEFEGQSLRDLLIEAIRYGSQPEVRERLFRKVEGALDTEKLRRLIQGEGIAAQELGLDIVRRVREDMERAEARRIQPHYVRAFFLEAFSRLGGVAIERESGRFEIRSVPATIRGMAREGVRSEPVLQRYERVVFEKSLIQPPGKPLAALLCPGHPLLDSTIDLLLQQHGNLLRAGAALVDENDPGTEPRVVVLLTHALQDDARDPSGQPHTISKRILPVELRADGTAQPAGYAPYLDLRPLSPDEPAVQEILARPEARWLSDSLEQRALRHAIEHFVPEHLEEVRRDRLARIGKIERAVRERLTAEINYWDYRAGVLKELEEKGKNPKMNWISAQRRAEELQERLKARLEELKLERNVRPQPPVVESCVLVVPIGLLRAMRGLPPLPSETQESAAKAREIVMAIERELGFEPVDRELDRCGYDVESRDPATGRLRLIEVKGRQAGADTITVTNNEVLTCLNKPDDYLLALVLFENGGHRVRYVPTPFRREPDFGVTSVEYRVSELLRRAVEPAATAR